MPTDERPRCPDCGRPVHRLPDGRCFTLMPAPSGVGWTLGPHACLPRGARYPMAAIVEMPPIRGIHWYGLA
jgi:hypothetical protein